MMLLERFRAWRRRHQLNQELDDELAAHLAIRQQRLVDSGLTPQEAARQSRLSLGSPAAWRESMRDIWIPPTWDNLWRDIIFSVRLLGREKAFSTVVILTLALGIGANTAIFSLINGLLLRPLPVHEPGELVRLVVTNLPPNERTFINGRETRELERRNLTYPLFEALSHRQQAFSGVFGVAGAGQCVVDWQGSAHQVTGSRVTGSYFPVLGVDATRGRLLTPADDVPGGPREGWTAVISDDLWARVFQRAPQAVGARITVERVPFTIVGVAAANFRGLQPGSATDIWVPLSSMEAIYPDLQWRRNHDSWMLTVYGRLRPMLSLKQSAEQLRTMSAPLLEEAKPRGMGKQALAYHLAMNIEPRDASRGESGLVRLYGPVLWFLLAAVGAVLLIAATSVANLLLARASSRRQEIATRAALGASPGRVCQQLLVESAMLATGGAICGIVLGQWLKYALLIAIAGGKGIPLDAPLDWRVAAFLTGVLVAVVLAAGWTPAWMASRSSASVVVRQQAGERQSVRLRAGLIVVQTALSFLLLGGAALMLATLRTLLGEVTGFDSRSTVLLTPDLHNAGLGRQDQGRAYRNILQEARLQPAVSGAAWTLIVPLTGALRMYSIDVPGSMQLTPRDRMVFVHQVSDGYFAAMGIPMRAGADLPGEESGRKDLCVVSETLARRYFGSASEAIGQVLTLSSAKRRLTVTGVAADSKYNNIREPSPATLYIPYWTDDPPAPGMTLALRHAGGPGPVIGAMEGLFRREAGRMPFVKTATIEGNLRESIRTERLIAVLLSGFAVFAVLIAAVGIGGLLSYSVVQRRREIGIRLAIGEQPSLVARRVWAGGLWMALCGILVGAALAYALRRVLDAYLFQVHSGDPAVWAAVAAILVVAASGAAMIPAWRAARVDPMSALRVD